MHYIIGTEITIGNVGRKGPIRPGMSSQQIRQSSPGTTQFAKHREKFMLGDTYSIIRIYTQEERVCYRFASHSGDVVEVLFDSVSEAERFISEVRNETLPDYERINRNKSD